MLHPVYELGLISCVCPLLSTDTARSCLFSLTENVTVCLLIIVHFFHVAKVTGITLVFLSLPLALIC